MYHYILQTLEHTPLCYLLARADIVYNKLILKSQPSFLKSLKSVCVCEVVWMCLCMHACIPKYMNTFVLMYGGCTRSACTSICVCLHVVPVCGGTCASLFLWTKEQSQQWGYFMPIKAWALSEWVGEGLWRSEGGSSQSQQPGRAMQQPVYGSNIKAVT